MTFEGVIKKSGTRGLREKDVRAYLEAGGDVNHRDAEMGWTLLYHAVEGQNPEVIKVLAAHGADLNVADVNGWTPLHLAVDIDIDSCGRDNRRPTELPTARLLIELGANSVARASNGKTPRDVAVDYGQENLFDTIAGAGAKNP